MSIVHLVAKLFISLLELQESKMKFSFVFITLVAITYGAVRDQSKHDLNTPLMRLLAKDRTFQRTFDEGISCTSGNCQRSLAKRAIEFAKLIKMVKTLYKGSTVTLHFGATTAKVASLALALTDATTEGCLLYPSICKNRDKIEQLEKENFELVQKLKTKYDNSQNDYVVLRKVTVNNIDIQNHLDGLSEKMNNIHRLSRNVESYLRGNNRASNVYKTFLSKKLEAEIKKSSSGTSNLLHESLAWSLAVYATSQAETSQVKTRSTITLNRRKETGGGAPSITIRRAKIKMQSLQALIQKPKGPVQTFATGTNAANRFVNSLTIITKAIAMYSKVKKWKAIAEKEEESVLEFEKAQEKLRAAWEDAQHTTLTVADVKLTAIEMFNDLIKDLAETVELASTETGGSVQMPSNMITKPLPAEILKLVAQESDIIEKQKDVLDLIMKTRLEMEKFEGWFMAMDTIVQIVNEGVKNGNDVISILKKMSGVFKYLSNSARQYQSQASLQNIVCVLTFMLPDSKNYAMFPLNIARHACATGTFSSISSSYANAHKNLAIDTIVFNSVKAQIEAKTQNVNICSEKYRQRPPECGGSLLDVRKVMLEYFTQNPLLTESDVPDLKTIVSEIAHYFPNESNFAFFELNLFRDGKVPTDAEFEDLDWEAEEKQHICINQARRKATDKCKNRPITP